ncbi:MAG: HTH domain-containing protein [Firmicutes bacterium]|jgi:hypothetical protein|nr:HTH domain-containing protein [Bacillota bacterium]
MKEILQLTLLYDFYGELLTEKQKLVYEMYYQNDLSLSEIGEELSISRQAVRDQLKRAEKILQNYEKKLQLVERFLKQKMAVQQIKSIIEEIEKEETLSYSTKNNIETIQKIAAEIIG